MGLQAHDSQSDSSDSDDDEEEKKAAQAKEAEEARQEAERNEPGETKKQKAFRNNRLKIIKLICLQLKKYDNDCTDALNVFDSEGRNALFYAIRTVCYEDTNGYNANTGAVDIFHLLIEMGASPDCMNGSAQTVVSAILEEQPSRIVQIFELLSERFDANKKLIVY